MRRKPSTRFEKCWFVKELFFDGRKVFYQPKKEKGAQDDFDLTNFKGRIFFKVMLEKNKQKLGGGFKHVSCLSLFGDS